MTKDNKDKQLSPKHQEFVRQYFLCGRNASKAYKNTYPDSNSANVDAAKLLANPSILEAVQKQEAEIEIKFEVTLEKIIQEYATIAFGSIGRVMDWNALDVSLIPKEELAEKDIKFIEAISYEKSFDIDYNGPKDNDGNYPQTPVVKIKVSTLAKEKTKALEALVKLLGYDKREDQVDDDLDEALAELDREAVDGQP